MTNPRHMGTRPKAKTTEAYELKCVARLKGLAESQGVVVHGTRWGTLGTDRSCCVLIEPGVSSEKVRELSQEAQKCFRRASVRMGNGASLPYAPEIIYHTIYLIFYGANHV